MAPPPDNATSVLGVPISVVDEAALLERIAACVDRREPTVFVGVYAALFRRMRRDSAYRPLVARSTNYPDGFGVVRELQLRGVAGAARLATTDVIHPIARLAAARDWKVVCYGAATGVAERAVEALQVSAPGLQVVGVWDGYSGGPTSEELQALQTDLVLIAIGAGAQEQYAYDVAVPAGVPVALTCGGLFDFLAGDRRRAPSWMQRNGLEWLFRIALEPRRLIGRYLAGNLDFVWRARRERRRLAIGHADL